MINRGKGKKVARQRQHQRHKPHWRRRPRRLEPCGQKSSRENLCCPPTNVGMRTHMKARSKKIEMLSNRTSMMHKRAWHFVLGLSLMLTKVGYTQPPAQTSQHYGRIQNNPTLTGAKEHGRTQQEQAKSCRLSILFFLSFFTQRFAPSLSYTSNAMCHPQ